MALPLPPLPSLPKLPKIQFPFFSWLDWGKDKRLEKKKEIENKIEQQIPNLIKLSALKYKRDVKAEKDLGLWTRCENCGVIIYIKHLQVNKKVCIGCNYHILMSSFERIARFLDIESWTPLNETMSSGNPLGFSDQKSYTERLIESQELTGLQDAVQTGTGVIEGIPLALGMMDFHFMGGSMGSVVGEKLTRLIEYATIKGLSLVIFCASGGARMQEGILSLMQMAKISAALNRHQNIAKLLYIPVLTSPTTGGVTASFAMLGDLIYAEPRALIGFAGRRVISQTLQEQLPKDFQTAEYLLHHGLIDLIISRFFLKQALAETVILFQQAPSKEIGSIEFRERVALTKVEEELLRRSIIENENSFTKMLESFLSFIPGRKKSISTDLAFNEVLDEAFDNSLNPSITKDFSYMLSSTKLIEA